MPGQRLETSLGGCKYNVLVVGETITGDNGNVADTVTALYSSGLQGGAGAPL
ncbi:MAG: hypothetical protein J0H31_29445 [Alphaproteobacteria bacterium]|nr:hypothetical protein [Alphaproteobacteria bacterium]